MLARLPKRTIQERLPDLGIRRGELSKAQIDRDWPHQVALPASACVGQQYLVHAAFCEGLSRCPRAYSFYKDGQDFKVFCFADRLDAELFQERFGGRFILPQDRPKWPRDSS